MNFKVVFVALQKFVQIYYNKSSQNKLLNTISTGESNNMWKIKVCSVWKFFNVNNLYNKIYKNS